MNFLDELLKHVDEDTGTPPAKRKTARVPQNEGIVAATDATPIGKLLVKDIDPTTFEASYRLVIDHRMWDQVEIVCDGKASEVDTAHIDGDRYRVKRRLHGFRPATVDEEHTIELREFQTTKEFIAWIETLDDDAVEALRQIYYDRWCFDSASQKDRRYYDILEEEKQGRQ